LSSLDVRPEAQAEFSAGLRKKLDGTIWTAGGCQSWYLDADGGTTAMWPGYTWQFRRALRTFDAQAYRLRSAPSRAAAPA
jgi:hypothetical protein